jgi:dephospho-CoA kinase
MPNNSNTHRIGITGGIGAGKTLISSVFMNLGIPVYDADDRAKFLMIHDKHLKKKILETFGSEAFKQDGSLNRNYLARNVFDDQLKLEKLNQLVHPVVRKDYLDWCLEYPDKQYTLKEAALLFETGSYQELDRTILVYAPIPLRIKRVLIRDPHRTKKDIEKIIEHQMDDEHKQRIADFIVYNDDSTLVIPQVLEIHKQLIAGK